MTLRSGSPFSLMYTFFDKEGPTAEKVLETETKTFETDIETFFYARNLETETETFLRLILRLSK